MKNNEIAKLLVECVDLVSGLTYDEYTRAFEGAVLSELQKVIWEYSRCSRWPELRRKLNAIAQMPDEWNGEVIFSLEKSH